MPTLKDFFFTRDSRALVGVTPLQSGNLQPISISTETGKTASFCPDISSAILRVAELDQKLFISTYDQDKRILNVHRQTPDFSCIKVNSVVVENSDINSIGEILISPDLQKIIVTLQQSKLFYIPLNGKPAYSVNTPVFESAKISEAFFSGDSQSVIYVGNQIRPGEGRVFLWKAPKE